MEWVRGEIIGKGSFGSVYLAIPRKDFNQTTTKLMAVKSVSVSQSSLLQKEKQILSQFIDCPQILKCFGEDYTIEKGEKIYNLLLEYASRGNLYQLMKKNSKGVLSEFDTRFYTKSILEGLQKIHERDYVHCDIKLQNILLCKGFNEVKIADFGLAKKTTDEEDDQGFGLRGTPLYMSPESISRNEQEAPSDIWAVGCIVAEMITGKPAWKCRTDSDVSGLLFRIGFGDELPEIPTELSEQGKDFLRKCFIRNPKKRWTAEMLLNHPFVHNVTFPNDCEEQPSPSPRSPFDFPDWCSTQSSSSMVSYQWDCSVSTTADRIRQLGITTKPNWCFTDSWITVRQAESSVSNRAELII